MSTQESGERRKKSVRELERDLERTLTELERVQAREAYFRKVFEYSNDMIFVLDPQENRILGANRHACEILGYEKERLLETPISAVHPDEMPQLLEFCNSVRTEGSGWTEDLSCTTRCGRKIASEISASTVRLEGKTLILAVVRDVSARRDAEKALKEREERFRDLYEEAPLMYCSVGVDGKILKINRQVTRVLGYSVEDLVGRPLSSIWIPDEDAQSKNKELFQHFLRGQEIRDEEVRVRASDGRMVWGSLSVKAIRNEEGRIIASRSVLMDITARKEAERALRESEERFVGILKSAMDAIVTMNPRMDVLLFNDAAEKVFRCPASKVVGTSFEALASPRLQEILTEFFENPTPLVEKGGYLWCPEGLTALRADGEEFPVEATISRAEFSGKELFTLILRDVDERRRSEEQLRRLQQENIYLQEELGGRHHFEEIIGTSPAIRRVLKLVEKVAEADTTVLITGETGTGKELIARALHARSPRANRPLISVNCAALPEGLIESELFGHEKGAFTGAIHRKIGRFELADGGTLFLDEIGDLPPETQVKLLRVLQEMEFERVGASQTIRVDVRVIAATNRSLEEAVENGRFRSDLYYRLNVFPIHLPPLRERREDIPLLVHYFVDKYAGRTGRRIERIPRAALNRFQSYRWPGNVRELENLVERALILSGGPEFEIDEDFFPSSTTPADGLTLPEVEASHIRKVLSRTKGVIEGPSGAARILGLNPSTLRSRLRELGIHRDEHTA